MLPAFWALSEFFTLHKKKKLSHLKRATKNCQGDAFLGGLKISCCHIIFDEKRQAHGLL